MLCNHCHWLHYWPQKAHQCPNLDWVAYIDNGPYLVLSFSRISNQVHIHRLQALSSPPECPLKYNRTTLWPLPNSLITLYSFALSPFIQLVPLSLGPTSYTHTPASLGRCPFLDIEMTSQRSPRETCLYELCCPPKGVFILASPAHIHLLHPLCRKRWRKWTSFLESVSCP